MSNYIKRERSAQYLTKKKFEHKLNDMLLDFATKFQFNIMKGSFIS